MRSIVSACVGLPVMMNTAAASRNENGTNFAANRSPTVWMRGLRPCASSTRLIRRPMAVSAPTLSTRTRILPAISSVPANTRPPGARSTGMLSPVIGASLIVPSPSSTIPSTGSFSPAYTAIRSPGRISAAARFVSTSPSTSHTS
jgi:hypothetical protein